MCLKHLFLRFGSKSYCFAVNIPSLTASLTMSLPFLTGGFVSSLPRLRSNSFGSASSHSGHSADEDAGIALDDSDTEHSRTIPAMVMASGAGVEQQNRQGP